VVERAAKAKVKVEGTKVGEEEATGRTKGKEVNQVWALAGDQMGWLDLEA
jgi:hypothetical protein